MNWHKSGLTELIRARDASCPKDKKMGDSKRLIIRDLVRRRKNGCSEAVGRGKTGGYKY